MVKSWHIITALLLTALLAWGADKPYYQYPDAKRIRPTTRFLAYDNLSGSRNVTGAQILSLSAGDPAFTSYTSARGGRLTLDEFWTWMPGKADAIHGGHHNILSGDDPIYITLNQVTGLTTALDGKAPTSHTQAATTITGLATVATTGSYNDLFSKPTIPTACVDVFDGAQGIQGVQGVAGADGRTVLSGSGTPSSGTGATGDFYVDLLTYWMYGPKTSVWGDGFSLVGPEGPEGPPGPPGTVDQATILSQIAIPGGNPLERQPLTPQTNGTVMIQVRDLTGNVRWYLFADGTMSLKNASGQLVAQVTSAGDILRYRAGGTKIAFAAYSTQVVIQ